MRVVDIACVIDSFRAWWNIALTLRRGIAGEERSQIEIPLGLHRQLPPPSLLQRDQILLVVCPLLPQGKQQLLQIAD